MGGVYSAIGGAIWGENVEAEESRAKGEENA